MSDPFERFRAATPARIGLGRAGDGWTTSVLLDFTLAHARARDAVHGRPDFDALEAALAPMAAVRVRTRAGSRDIYLRRPDLGRRLESREGLPQGRWDVALVVADGLSSLAVDAQAAGVLKAVLPLLANFTVAPIVLASQARVALGDEIGEALGARLCALLVGERPGLTVQDSLGVYVTYGPRIGRTDAERNCISNIHARGLSHDEAAHRLAWLIREALSRGLTGVDLKEDAQDPDRRISPPPSPD